MKISQHNIIPGFNQLIDEVLGSDTFETVKRNLINKTPLANIQETETSHIIELAIPGVKKENVKIDLKENKLIISAESEKSNSEESNKSVRKEFEYTKFTRAFNLPKNIDLEKINAKTENGILHITIPKKEEEIKKNRTIEIS